MNHPALSSQIENKCCARHMCFWRRRVPLRPNINKSATAVAPRCPLAVLQSPKSMLFQLFMNKASRSSIFYIDHVWPDISPSWTWRPEFIPSSEEHFTFILKEDIGPPAVHQQSSPSFPWSIWDASSTWTLLTIYGLFSRRAIWAKLKEELKVSIEEVWASITPSDATGWLQQRHGALRQWLRQRDSRPSIEYWNIVLKIPNISLFYLFIK